MRIDVRTMMDCLVAHFVAAGPVIFAWDGAIHCWSTYKGPWTPIGEPNRCNVATHMCSYCHQMVTEAWYNVRRGVAEGDPIQVIFQRTHVGPKRPSLWPVVGSWR